MAAPPPPLIAPLPLRSDYQGQLLQLGEPCARKWVPALPFKDRMEKPGPNEQSEAWDNYQRAERIALMVDWLNVRCDGQTLREIEAFVMSKYNLSACPRCNKHYVGDAINP